MGSRIVTLQRQVRELGRLRAGFTDTNADGRPFPRSSRTWIVTSQNRGYVEVAAELWGGQAEQWQPQGNRATEWRVVTERSVIDAILPPGDPINQAYEMWSAGGCQRRCDGEQEKITGETCLCIARFGEHFHQVPHLGPDKKPQRCQMHTRLNVFLPELPDIGIWRVETKGYWPGVHIVGYVETIKGLVGEQVMVPVTLAIDPKTKPRRTTNPRTGEVEVQTSKYIEIVVALKERTSFGQIIAAPQSLAIGGPSDTRTIEAGEQRPAIGSASAHGSAEPEPTEPIDWPSRISSASALEELQAVGEQIAQDPLARRSSRLRELWIARRDAIKAEAEARAKTQGSEDDPWAEDPPTSPEAVENEDQAEASAPATHDEEPPEMGVWRAAIDAADNLGELRAVWDEMQRDQFAKGNKLLASHWWKRKRALDAAAKQATAVVEAEPSRDAMWMEILTLAGERGWTTTEVGHQFRDVVGVEVHAATGWHMRDFRDHLLAEVTA